MALIKVKDAGQTPDQFKTLVTNGNPIPEGTVAGNIIIADENAQTADSGVSVSSLLDGTQPVGDSAKLGGKSADTYYNLDVPTNKITSTDDIDTFTEFGTLVIPSGVKPINYPSWLPSDTARRFKVEKYWNNRCEQKITVLDESNTTIVRNNMGGVWQEWQRVVYTENISNPNLLINGDFRVNQRGASSYTGTSGYTVDMWKIKSGTPIVTVNDDGSVTLGNADTNNAFLTQEIEHIPYGETVTVSCKLEDGTVISTVGTIPTENTSVVICQVYFGELSQQLYLEMFDTGRLFVTLRIRPSSSYTLKYVKLELGNVATPFTPRPYAEELALCQRYLWLVPYNGVMIRATEIFSNYLTFEIPLPTSMNNTTTLIGEQDVGILIRKVNSSDNETGFTTKVLRVVNNIATITATKTNHGLTDGVLYLLTGCGISAEL